MRSRQQRPGPVPAKTAVRSAAMAGADAGQEMVDHGAVADLRDNIAVPLRSDRGPTGPVPALGCPCGCGEAELLSRARAGDDTALNELLTRYRSLARAKARSYFLIGADHDDVVQEGMIGLYKAIRDYDADLGASFRGFAEMCVTRQIISAIKGAARHKHAPLSQAVSFDQPARADDDGGTSLADLIPATRSSDPEAAAVSGDEIRAMQRHFDEVLTDLEAQVLRHHVEGKTYDEIAAMLQRHVKAVDNALQRIRRKLQTHLDERAQ